MNLSEVITAVETLVGDVEGRNWKDACERIASLFDELADILPGTAAMPAAAATAPADFAGRLEKCRERLGAYRAKATAAGTVTGVFDPAVITLVIQAAEALIALWQKLRPAA